MDHSLSLSPSKVTHYKGHNQIRDQEEEKVADETNRNYVTVCTGLDEETESLEMRYGGAGSRLYTVSELESSSDMNSEDAMMDKLFQACDFQGKGRIRVSDLVKYLTAIVDMQLQDGSAVKSLIAIMDPKNTNAEIDSQEFHRGLHKWIEQIKSGHLMDMSVLSSKEDSIAFDTSHTDGMESSNDESIMEDKLSVSHLSGRLTDLQYLNRKLSDGIKESQAIIDSKEEELSKLIRDLQNAKSERKRLLELEDLRHETEAENEELREQVTTLNKKLDAEKHKICNLEQEKEHQKIQLEKYKAQAVKLASDLDISKEKQEELKSLLAESQEKKSQLKMTCSGLDAQLSEKNECIQELQTCLREVTKLNEDLKNQIQHVQGHLSDTQQELLSLRSVLDKTNSSVTFSTLREMANDFEEDVEQLKTISAKEFPSSIHNELQDLFNDSPNLPWPLSEKELKESVVTTPDLVSQVGHAVNTSIQSNDEEVDHSEQSVIPSVGSLGSSDGSQVRNQCSCDYHYDISNEKLRLFVSLLKYFKEENQKLRAIIAQSCLDKKNFTEPSLRDSKKRGPNDQENSQFLKQEEMTGQKRIKKLQNYSEKLLQEITNLKRSNVKLTEELHKSELFICELDEVVQNSKSSLTREKQRSAELEESLYNSTLARQLDLRDIWRLVQKDVEIECEDFQEDCINIKTSEQLKEQIKKEIEALRTQLQKREASLGSLKNSNLNFHSSLNCNDICQTSSLYNSRKLSPSSPLVDALTIDAFNGNLPMYHNNYPYTSSFVSCEDVDCYECRVARLFLQHRFATSCPSFVPSKVSNTLAQGLDSNNEDTEHQINGEDGYPETRTRSLEVSTNADCCFTNVPKRKRSLYGSYRRQDFIRSSGRGLKDNTPHVSFQSSQQSELSTAAHKNSHITIGDNIKTSHQSVSNGNTLDSSSNHLPADYYLPVTGDSDHTLGVRRSSFKQAVECYQQDQTSSVHAHACQTKKDNSSSIEELRRPSFHAAIEHGKDALNSSSKRKVVQIASPEITESREITVERSTHRSDKTGSLISSNEATKAVKFYFDETELDPYDGLHSEAVQTETHSYGEVYDKAVEEDADLYGGVYTDTVTACGSNDQKSNVNVPAASYSSQSSGFVSTTSDALAEDLDYSLSLPLRYSQEQEHVDITNMFTSKESNQEHTDVSVSESSQAWEVLPADMNQDILNTKEASSGKNVRDRLAQSPSERCAKAQEGKPLISGTSAGLPSSTRHGLTVTSTTSALKSFPSPSSLLTATSSPPAGLGVPTRSPVKNLGIHEKTRESTEAGITRSLARAQNSKDDSSVSEVRTSSGKTVTSTSRSPGSATHVTQPPVSSKLSKIRQSHVAIKKREQMKARSMKLPELTENTELDCKAQHIPATMTDRPVNFGQVNTAMDMPQISVTDEDADAPPAPSDDIFTPSLPDSFLAKLGLSVIDPSSGDNGNQIRNDQLSEKDIESKFVSLSLAFKSDKLTLDRRISVQERSRDLAEQNVDIELKGLRTAVETLTELVTDVQLRGLLQKIKLHINVLEQAAARVSSSAEVFGAVQQERRLCRAVEVMVQYTENLRRIREKEESELHEARKLLSERTGNSLSVEAEASPGRRSLSVSGYNSLGRMSSAKPQQRNIISNTMSDAGDLNDSESMRRRSEIALPRVIGGVGSPALTPSAAQEILPPFLGHTNNNAMSQQSEEGEDPKSRFQSAVAGTSMQNVVTTTMRRCSLEKQYSASSTASLSPSVSFGSSSRPILTVTTGSISDTRRDKTELRISKDEDAFRKGFEEGLRSKLSHELNDLRDQQNSISHSLEDIMDRVEQSQLEDAEYFSRPSRLETALSLVSTVGGQVLQHDWRSNKKVIRYLAGVFFVFLAIFLVFFSPPISTVDVKHFTKPPT